jgi:hypothetical protein
MNPDANRPASDDQHAKGADAIEDLSDAITSADADQVKGGFNPQPEPPRLFDPRVLISAKYLKQ